MSGAVLSPRAQALAYRIWAHCEPLGWDCTAGEVAAALGVTPQAVGRVCRLKGWGNRLRDSGKGRPVPRGGWLGLGGLEELVAPDPALIDRQVRA